MMGFSYEFELPGVFKSLNVVLRMNPHARNRYYKEIYDQVWWETLNLKPKIPLSKAYLRFDQHCHRFRDYDGFVGSLKPVVDGLTHAKIIQDDKYSITGPWGCYQHKVPKREKQRLIVHVSSTYPAIKVMEAQINGVV